MTRTAAPDDFAAYVAARGRALWRAAWLLTGDAALAEDLVQTAPVLGAAYTPGMTDCGAPAADGFGLRLRTADGRVHEVAVGPCGETTIDGRHAGLTDPDRFLVPS